MGTTLGSIQARLLTILTAMPVFAGYSTHLYSDNGTHEADMVKSLAETTHGFCVIVGPPMMIHAESDGATVTAKTIACVVTLRTNPKIAAINPPDVADQILDAVVAWNPVDAGFVAERHFEPFGPETIHWDHADAGFWTYDIRFKKTSA